MIPNGKYLSFYLSFKLFYHACWGNQLSCRYNLLQLTEPFHFLAIQVTSCQRLKSSTNCNARHFVFLINICKYGLITVINVSVFFTADFEANSERVCLSTAT